MLVGVERELMGLLIGRGCEISHASSVGLVLPQASSGDGTSRGCYMLIVVEEEVVKEAMKEKKKEER